MFPIDFFKELINPSIPFFSILVLWTPSAFLYNLSKHSLFSLSFSNLALLFFCSLYYLSNSSCSTKCSNFISLVKAETVFFSISPKLALISSVGSITTAALMSFLSFSRAIYFYLTISSGLWSGVSFLATRVFWHSILNRLMALFQELIISDWVSWAFPKAQIVFYSDDLELATVRQFTSLLSTIKLNITLHGVEFDQRSWEDDVGIVVSLEDSKSGVVQYDSHGGSGRSLESWQVITHHFHISFLYNADLFSLGSFRHSESLDFQRLDNGFGFSRFER